MAAIFLSVRCRLTLLVLIAIALPSFCYGHGTVPPPPRPPAAPRAVRVSTVYPPRWSWLHWWEANRDPYLDTVRQGRGGQKPDQKVIQRFRAQAVEALLEAMKSERWMARASAALALGQMAEPSALDPLKKLSTADPVTSVRVFALVALGLLDSPGVEEFFLNRDYPTPEEAEAALVAVGHLKSPTDDTVAGLQKLLQGTDVGRATVAAWALRFHSDPANPAFLRNVLGRSTSPWLTSEAILGLGLTGDVRSAAPLADILLVTDIGKRVPAWEELENRDKWLRSLAGSIKIRAASYNQTYERYVETYKKWQESNPNAPGPRQKRRRRLPVGITMGAQRIYQSRLRASAAIALGNVKHPDSARILHEALNERNNEYSDLYKGFVIMSLGQLGDARALPAMLELLSPTRDGRVRKSSAKWKSPLRGYAALALGLYARPIRTEQGPQPPPHYARVCRLLAERVADPNDTPEVRTAAALGLGLTGQTENLKLLQAACRMIRPRDEILVGYALLGRGMLGDENIIPPARQFLAVANDRADTAGMLARRAAVLGLGVLGSEEAIPILIDAWGLSYYVNREVALSFSLLESYNVTEPLVKLLGESANPLEQAFAARCLGQLFTSTRPTPGGPQKLNRLINGSNYTVKNMRMVRFQALANEFLFSYLIPSFGKDWR